MVMYAFGQWKEEEERENRIMNVENMETQCTKDLLHGNSGNLTNMETIAARWCGNLAQLEI